MPKPNNKEIQSIENSKLQDFPTYTIQLRFGKFIHPISILIITENKNMKTKILKIKFLKIENMYI